MSMLKHTSWSLFALLLPAVAAAQNPPAPPITAGWQDGFVLQSGNGDFRLQLGLTLQTDGRFVLDDAPAVINTPAEQHLSVSQGHGSPASPLARDSIKQRARARGFHNRGGALRSSRRSTSHEWSSALHGEPR